MNGSFRYPKRIEEALLGLAFFFTQALWGWVVWQFHMLRLFRQRSVFLLVIPDLQKSINLNYIIYNLTLLNFGIMVPMAEDDRPQH